MEEKEESLGRPLTRNEMEALLKAFGHPLIVAGRYRTFNHLIGPGGRPQLPCYGPREQDAANGAPQNASVEHATVMAPVHQIQVSTRASIAGTWEDAIHITPMRLES